ncbi:HPr family phosphocarrier protein [Cellulosilyticum ruminicola]|uniref:HPr family phosphocarrier protein n=1 Tax=Cellulosilyticum ruminicola TaxID=425254 RepID=UPI0006D279B6|nr:HPr family phosphocarrier protein [Cellulosilyticum ruminicola]
MKSIQISLNSIEKVKQFVNIINAYDCDFDLSSGRYIIDAKSIMGIFSLDLGKPLRLDIYDDGVADNVIKELIPFVYET